MLRLNLELGINNKTISSDGLAYFIANSTTNHDRNLTCAINLTYLAVKACADTAKFQIIKDASITTPRRRSRSALPSYAIELAEAMTQPLPMGSSNRRVSIASS